MEFLDERLEEYARQHTSNPSRTLQELERETWAKVLIPRMLSGHLQGRYLSMMAKLMHAKSILEIGTYTGYSAICMAEALSDDGALHTIDVNEELEPMIRRYFENAGVSDKVTFHLGNAVDVIPTINETWDLVFIDADKENYSRYFDLVIDRMNPGGCIIADNVLWSGKVLDENPDQETKSLMEYSEKVNQDPRVESLLLPIRDGLMMCRVK